MMNLDAMQEKKLEIQKALADSIRENDEDGMKKAMDDWMDFVSNQIMAESRGITEATDRSILAARGVRQLTSEETKYYESLIAEATRQEGVITNIMSNMPETIIDQVLDDMKTDHPLLDEVDFVNTSDVTKWIFNTQGAQQATWDELNTEFTNKLGGAIDAVSTTLCKLTAYMFCTKDMLALGPKWVDNYCRNVLSEALAVGLEVGIVDGNGLKQPTGMTRNIRGDLNQVTGYPRKEAISVRSFDPETFGLLLAQLSRAELTGIARTVASVILVVNPYDYFTKVMPATTLLTPDGRYVTDIFPFPTKVIQSVAVPENHAVLGVGKWFFMGLGTAGRGGKLEYDDSVKFLEDLRTYTIRLYGNGRAKDNNSFLYLDISALRAPLPGVYLRAEEDANLASLTIGSLELTPAFDKTVTSYTATATSASAAVLAIPKDGDADIAITAGETPVANGNSASFANNAVTTLTFKVTNGGTTKTYTVAVTRGTPA